MTEYERVGLVIRGEIQSYTCTVCMECAKAIADKILSLEGICIKADDQSLPNTSGVNNLHEAGMLEAQQDMLKAGFVKVKPTEV